MHLTLRFRLVFITCKWHDYVLYSIDVHTGILSETWKHSNAKIILWSVKLLFQVVNLLIKSTLIRKDYLKLKNKQTIYQCRVRVIRTLGHWHSDSSEAAQQSAASNEGCKYGSTPESRCWWWQWSRCEMQTLALWTSRMIRSSGWRLHKWWSEKQNDRIKLSFQEYNWMGIITTELRMGKVWQPGNDKVTKSRNNPGMWTH